MTHPIKQTSMDGAQWVSSPASVYGGDDVGIQPNRLGSRLNSLKLQDAAESREQLVQAGQEFEAYFISYLLKVMRETVPEGALANKQGAYFYSFYDEEIGRRAAESGGIGIARMVQEYANKHFSSSPVKDSSSGG